VTGATARKLVTIVTEAALEATLARELDELGAPGYTITDARGRGSRGVRSAGWDLSGNIRVEVVCGADVAHAIAARLRERYYDD
jgi:nitrogen regulatory protein PII